MLRVAGFANDSIVDGPGLRFTVFFQGCPHHCPGCHNPETWPFEGGQQCTPEQLLALARRNPLCRGVTLSGGEPFAQAGPELVRFALLCREAGYELAAYTGYTFEQLASGTPEQRALLAQLDTLIDGPFVQAGMSLDLRFRGSRNQRILNVPQSLCAGAPVWETGERWVGAHE
ncbi:anaerobic ribonucleoside-triphosphate reductase activating protein [Oscillospiraceae bacterium]|uniref:4Fe-4S single cluster domain-containing protein n=1 Tax=Allofournierella sp. TaxID=1940256 RepID=UPI0015B01E66|nr:anaerobic ribonucleoside-triphosphate reductase activating protein [Oscillospiraceae bacterium]